MELITFDTNLDEPQTHLPIVEDVSFKAQKNIYLVGDLHGNFIKLLSVLIHFKFIIYRDDPTVTHDLILREFKKFQDAAYDINGNITFPDVVYNFLDQIFHLNAEIFNIKKIIFLGDTLCDRGPSDFITLLIFEWMSKIGIQYSGLIGNHEFTICIARLFSDQPNMAFNKHMRIEHPCYQSFDYYQLNVKCKNIFRDLFYKYLKKLSLFQTFSSSTQILLTHAPVTKESFNKLSKLYLKSQNHSWDQLTEDIRLQFKIQHSNKTKKVPIEWMNCIYEFCTNRKLKIPFFISKHHGINIFGHMSGTLYIQKNNKDTLAETQLCIDRCTGIPSMHTGQIAYVILLDLSKH